MRAVILVGGFGTRLRPLTFTIPKQMLPIVEVPMIERKIAHLVSHGVDDIVLSMGYRPDAFREAYPENECAGATLHYVVEPEPLGTAGAIAYAARESGIGETFLAFNGDTMTDIDISAIVALHRERGAEGTVSLTPVEDPSRFGVVPTDENDRVIAFIEKPPIDQAPTNLINAGTYVLEPSFLHRVTPHQPVSIEREVFPHMVTERTLYAGHFDTYWLDIGTPAAYLQANLDVLDSELRGAAHIAPSAKVGEGTHIERSAVGAGAHVGDRVRIVDSVILPGTILDDDVVVEGSIVAENSHVGRGARLRDLTVVGGHLSVPPGVVLHGERVSPPEDEV